MDHRSRFGVTGRAGLTAVPSQNRPSSILVGGSAGALFDGRVGLPSSIQITGQTFGLDDTKPFPGALAFATDPVGAFVAGGAAHGSDDLGAITIALEFDRGSDIGGGGGPTSADQVSYSGAYTTVQSALDALIGAGGATSTAFLTMTAGSDLSGHRVVKADSVGNVVYPNAATLADGQALIGITTGSISNGDDGTVQIAGLMIEPSWTWAPGLPVYCADSGVLTQTPPSGKWVRQIAVAIGATAILISLQTIISTP